MKEFWAAFGTSALILPVLAAIVDWDVGQMIGCLSVIGTMFIALGFLLGAFLRFRSWLSLVVLALGLLCGWLAITVISAAWQDSASGSSLLLAWVLLSSFFFITGVGIRLLAATNPRKLLLGFVGPAWSIFIFILLVLLKER